MNSSVLSSSPSAIMAMKLWVSKATSELEREGESRACENTAKSTMLAKIQLLYFNKCHLEFCQTLCSSQKPGKVGF